MIESFLLAAGTIGLICLLVWALQTLDNAVVEGKTKPKTNNKFIWYHCSPKLSYLYNPSICTNMKNRHFTYKSTFRYYYFLLLCTFI